MTVLSAVQLAAPWIGIEVPSVVYTSTDRVMVEMQAVANEAAQQISDDHDWTVLKTINTVTGDGSDVDFDLPADYDRLPKDAQLHSSVNTTVPLDHILSENEWLALDVQGIDYPYGRWIIYGGSLYIKPARASGETVKHFYISNARVTASGGSNKALFTADDDTFRIDERLLKLAIIWLWKAQKGQDYQEDLYNYQVALSKAIGRDRGPATIAVGPSRRWPGSASVAYPYALGST